MTRPTEYDDFERALLGSARADGMAPEKKRALAMALGGGAAAAVMTTASSAAGAAKATHGVLGGALVKWLLAVAVGTTVAGSAGVAAMRTGSDAAPLTMASAPAPAPLKRATSTVAPTPVTAAATTMNANDLPAVPTVATPAPRASAPPASITEEIAIVSRARQALRAGDVAAASSALDAHDRQFPHGALGEESMVLRVEITHTSDPARGKRLGRAFLAKHPESPHAARVRALVGADE